MGGLFAQGLIGLLDGQQRYVRSEEMCFLRLQNFKNDGDFQEVGVPYAPTGVEKAKTGFTDILIDPPPETIDTPNKDIGLSGGKLMFGARDFIVSVTFVLDIMEKYPDIDDPIDVFRKFDGNTPVIGLIYSNQLWSIESIVSRELGGQIISFKLSCNALENRLDKAIRPALIP